MTRMDEEAGEAEDLAAWSRLIAGRRPHLSSITIEPGPPFHGSLRRNYLDGFRIDVLDVRAGPHVVRRTRDHIRRSPIAEHMVVFQLDGRSDFAQAGSTAELGPGDVTTGSAQAPWDWRFAGDIRMLVLRFSQRVLTVPAARFGSSLARRVRPESGAGAHVARFAAELAREPDAFRGDRGQRVAEALLLLCEAELLPPDAEGPAIPPATRDAFDRVTDFALRRAGDATLDIGEVAAGCFLSVRQVQRLFRAHDTTFGEWLRARRLQAIRRDLADPGLRALAIGRIAAAHGFADPAHLARAFRAAFDESPRQWRERSHI